MREHIFSICNSLYILHPYRHTAEYISKRASQHPGEALFSYGATIWLNRSFQLLLCIMKEKSQGDNSFVVWIFVTSCEKLLIHRPQKVYLFQFFLADRKHDWQHGKNKFFTSTGSTQCKDFYRLHKCKITCFNIICCPLNWLIRISGNTGCCKFMAGSEFFSSVFNAS